METLHLLFNAITVIFIAATMFAAVWDPGCRPAWRVPQP